MYFLLTYVLNKKRKRLPSVFMYDVIIRHCKNFVPSHDLGRRGLFSQIKLLLDWTTKMDKFVSRIPSSAISSSIAALRFPLSSKLHSEQQLLDLSDVEFFFAKEQDRLPDGCSSFKPILPKNFSPPLQKNLPLLAFSSGCGPVMRAGQKWISLFCRHC